jgi:hypothetical protein
MNETVEKDASSNHDCGQDRKPRPHHRENIGNVMAVRKERTSAKRQFAVSIEQEEQAKV